MSLPQVGFRRNCFLARLSLALGADGQQATQPSDSVKQQVRSLIREAGQLVERGDNRGAAARLEQARVLWSEPSIDYNLGIVYGDLGQPHEAAQALERFLRSADRSMVLTERLEDAKRRLREYERTLSRLAVTVTLRGFTRFASRRQVCATLPFPSSSFLASCASLPEPWLHRHLAMLRCFPIRPHHRVMSRSLFISAGGSGQRWAAERW